MSELQAIEASIKEHRRSIKKLQRRKRLVKRLTHLGMEGFLTSKPLAVRRLKK